jgi:hypothetical protein
LDSDLPVVGVGISTFWKKAKMKPEYRFDVDVLLLKKSTSDQRQKNLQRLSP